MADIDPQLTKTHAVAPGLTEVSALMAAALETQRQAVAADMPVAYGVRVDRLKRLVALARDNSDALCDALAQDFGHRSREQSQITDIAASIRAAKHALKHLDQWMQPEKRKVDFPLNLLGARARVEFQPKGVIGIIAPWNFPVQLTLGPLIGAFAAGNRAMVKTSEYTPVTGALLAERAARLFDPAEVAFFDGGPDVGQAFARLPFDHLVFTGAGSIARHILHAAADNLTPVTLELGGKSPTIIGRSADIVQAAERIVMGKMMNAGQICLAPDYLLVPDDKEGDIVEALKAAALRMYPTLLANPDYTSVVNSRHYGRLNDLIADARAGGAKVVEVAPSGEDMTVSANSNDPRTANRMALHLIRGVKPELRVMREEIFGPVLPILTYHRIDEAIAWVNAGERPLGLYYFGKDRAEEAKVLRRTVSGGVTINDVIFHTTVEDLPFGGIGPSGMGAYHGRDGFRTFSHTRAIYTQPRIDIAGLAGFKPPYSDKTRKMIARELR